MMHSAQLITPEQEPKDLQHYLSWDLNGGGSAFSTAFSSLSGKESNPSSIDDDFGKSTITTPSTLFGDGMDSPKLDSKTLDTSADSLFPSSSSHDNESLFDYGSFYREHSRSQRSKIPSQKHIVSTSLNELEVQTPSRQNPERPTLSDSQSDAGDSVYAESRPSTSHSIPLSSRPRTTRRKRSLMDTTIATSLPSSKRSKRPGSVVDKKYRDKLKDKMAELRRTVPTVRAALESEGSENGDGLTALIPASNSRKPTVLTKAFEYIRFLEDRNERLSAQLMRASPSCA